MNCGQAQDHRRLRHTVYILQVHARKSQLTTGTQHVAARNCEDGSQLLQADSDDDRSHQHSIIRRTQSNSLSLILSVLFFVTVLAGTAYRKI